MSESGSDGVSGAFVSVSVCMSLLSHNRVGS